MSTTVPAIVLPELITIPDGTFLMGGDAGQDCERPVHHVAVSSFRLAATQVTNAEYALFLAGTGRAAPPQWNDPNFGDPQQPVVSVSWCDAGAYCEWLRSVSGQACRLPTEAEWEFAARGGLAGAAFPWGDAPPHTRENYAARWRNGPEPVGTSAPNGYGLFDMCENVHEWCSDWYEAQYYAVSPERDPQGPANGTRKASRGGSWRHHIKIARCSARSSIPPEFRYADYGFRVACDADSSLC